MGANVVAQQQDSEAPKDGRSEQEEKQQQKLELEERLSETEHSVRIDGRLVDYLARAGTIVLRNEEGKARASFFFVSYSRLDVEDAASRPLTFSFNGGPGSSSVWLHMGAFGPRRVDLGLTPEPVTPPYQLVENEYSLLDVSDLVFIDPVTTGFSRAAPGEDAKQFHGVSQDVESVGEFIRLYLTRFQRWASPKFLAGESYGTTRAAGLSGYLQDRHGIYLNGIILVSSILDFQTARFDPGNDLPYLLFLPTYTATAWYHQQLPEDLQQNLESALQEARQFALNEYALALLKGDQMLSQERELILDQLSRLTGLSRAFLEQSNLRVSIRRFVKELLRSQRRTVGRLDTRFTGIDADAAGESFDFDPSYAAIQGPYSTLLNDYVNRQLKFESDLPYEILTGRVRPWSYDEASNRYLNVAETLREAMSKNPHLRVFVANGYYDLATPFFATEYTFDHLGLDPALSDHVTLTYYPAGHMMYIDPPSLAQLKQDIAGFVQEALGEQ